MRSPGRRAHNDSRADAILDGVLIDVSTVASEAGIRYPVALTRAVWERCVSVPPGVICQDEPGRLWDVIWMLRCSIRGRFRLACLPIAQ